MEILLFGGTTDGRNITQWLSRRGVRVTVCVATEYGADLLTEGEFVVPRIGRIDEAEMAELMKSGKYKLVIDATHPYASVVTKNIEAAAKEAGITRYRLLRDENISDNCIHAESMAHAAEILQTMPGNILLTTGSKDLDCFVSPALRDRCFPRVLADAASLNRCLELGFPKKNILCMQGPFSRALNEALIDQYDIGVMLTKVSGTAGGFMEKVEAAESKDCKLVVVDRPTKEEGYSISELKDALSEFLKKSGKVRKTVYLIGAGMGTDAMLTREAVQGIDSAELVIGATRLIEPHSGKKRKALIYPNEITGCIEESNDDIIAVLLSGDLGFYSGAAGLRDKLTECEVISIPGISSLSYFCAKLGTTWQDVHLASAHGRSHNSIGEIRSSKRTFLLTGGSANAASICREMTKCGLGNLKVSVGENLGYPHERIITGTAAEVGREQFADLSVMLVENERPVAREFNAPSLRDDMFLRGKAPMTKQEIRALAISKLQLKADHVLWDVGAGTGSVSIEGALAVPAGRVYAIEKKADALALLAANKEKFAVSNLEIIAGEAPDALTGVPIPDRVFLGGTSGNLGEIMNAVLARNHLARFVVTAVTLETLQEAVTQFEVLEMTDVEIIQVAVTRTREVGAYHMLEAANPVWMISGEGKPWE